MAKLIGSVALAPPSDAIAAEVITLTQSTTSMAQYASQNLNFEVSNSGSLIGFAADKSCLIRVYSSSAARTGDARAYNVSISPTGIEGLIAEVEIDIAIRNQIDANVVFGNSTSILYLKVFNLGTVGAIAVSLRVVKFQSVLPITTVPYGGLIEFPTVKTFPIFVANTDYSIDSIIINTSSGSCMVAVQIDGVSVTGMSAIAVTTTRQTVLSTALKTMSAGNRLTLVITSVSSAADLEFTLSVSGA